MDKNSRKYAILLKTIKLRAPIKEVLEMGYTYGQIARILKECVNSEMAVFGDHTLLRLTKKGERQLEVLSKKYYLGSDYCSLIGPDKERQTSYNLDMKIRYLPDADSSFFHSRGNSQPFKPSGENDTQ